MVTRPGAAGSLIALLLATAGLAADGGPLETIRSSNETIARLFRSGRPPSDAEREEALRMIESSCDFSVFSRRILGARWDTATEAQQAAFVSAFSRLVGLSSIRKLGRFRADRVEYLGEEADGEEARVRTAAFYKDKRVRLDYELARVGGEWKIVDYALNGVETSTRYRQQFDKILPKEGLDGLITRLRRKLEDLERRSAP